MIESFFDFACIQKLIDFGNASELHSSVTFCPMAAPTNWFCIITIGGTATREANRPQLHHEMKRQMEQKIHGKSDKECWLTTKLPYHWQSHAQTSFDMAKLCLIYVRRRPFLSHRFEMQFTTIRSSVPKRPRMRTSEMKKQRWKFAY